MTRQEIIELQNKIEKYFDILEERFVHTRLVLDTIEVLFEHGITEERIKMFLYMMGEFVEEVRIIIYEIENDSI